MLQDLGKVKMPWMKQFNGISKIRKFPLKDDSPWGQATVEPTVIQGGRAINQIPDLVEIMLDIRPTFAVNNEKIISMLDQAGFDYQILKDPKKTDAM